MCSGPLPATTRSCWWPGNRGAVADSPPGCAPWPVPPPPIPPLDPVTVRPDRQELHPMTDRVVLAFSGGLDTSVAIGWIAAETGAEVVAVAIDVGQGGEDLEGIRQRALTCGAV